MQKGNKSMLTVPEISVHELEALILAKANIVILDVRNPNEHAICHLNGLLIPLNELPNRLGELNKDEHIIVHCHAGGRSKRATEYLLSLGYSHVENLRGGITAWATEIDPKMAIY